jgi:hypothetical protein
MLDYNKANYLASKETVPKKDAFSESAKSVISSILATVIIF